jgi:hypothetical protein
MIVALLVSTRHLPGIGNERNHMDEHNALSSQSSTAPHQASGTGVMDDHAAAALKSTVAAGASDLKDEAKHVVEDLASLARKSAESQVSGGKDKAAETLGGVAKALRHTGEQLRSQDQGGLTDYVVRAADKVEAASDYLQGRSLRDVISDVGDFARREPALFIGSAFTVGLLGGRFFKSARPVAPATGSSSAGQMGIGLSPSAPSSNGSQGIASSSSGPNAGTSSAKVPGAF